MICDGCLVMLACNPSPGAVAIPRLDDVAELHKEFQVICCWADGCLGQLLQRVMFVKWWWRQASAVCAAEVGSVTRESVASGRTAVKRKCNK